MRQRNRQHNEHQLILQHEDEHLNAHAVPLALHRSDGRFTTFLKWLAAFVLLLAVYLEYHKLNYTALPDKQKYEARMINLLRLNRNQLLEFADHENNYELDPQREDVARRKRPVGSMDFFAREDQLPLCVVMPKYHALPLYVLEHSFNSVFRQNYSNYRLLIYRHSEDSVNSFVRSYLQRHTISPNKYRLIDSPPAASLQNIQDAVHNHCQKQSYVLVLQGGNAFLSKEVFKLFSLAFTKSNNSFIVSDHARVSVNFDFLTTFQSHLPTPAEIQELDLKNKTNYRLFAFSSEVFKEISPSDFKDGSGRYFEDLIVPLITPLLQLSCGTAMRLGGRANMIEFFDQHYERRQALENATLQQLKQRKRYDCSKYMQRIRAINLRGLEDISQPRRQKGGIMKQPPRVQEISDFLRRNSEGKTIAEVLYPTKSERAQREMFHRTRTEYIRKHGKNFPGLAMVEYNMKLNNSSQERQVADEEKEYLRLHEKYGMGNYDQQLAMCLVVCGYNNNANSRIEYNLNSILRQNYSNYFAVILNDASNDGSDLAYRKYFNFYNVSKDKYVYISTKQRRTALQNIYDAVNNYCGEDSIAMTVDGDDELIGKNVLSLFNSFYQRLKGGFIYSNFYQYIPSEIIYNGTSRYYDYKEKEEVKFREIHVKGIQIRSFNSSLFRSIDKSNFLDTHGNFYRMTYDVAIVIPTKERACGRVYFIPERHYLYNYLTGLNDAEVDEKLQISVAKEIRKKKKLECDPYFQSLTLYQEQ